MKIKEKKYHKSFRLNGKAFSSNFELLLYSKTISQSVFNFLTDWLSESDYIEVQTSGSTGKPKQILLKKEYMNNSAEATGEFFNLKQNTKALLCLSIDYIAGKMMLVRAMNLGWQIDIVKASSVVEVTKEYDFAAMVPMQLKKSLATIRKIKKLIVGGGVVDSNLLKEIQTVETKIYATYGMTETITHIAVKKLNNFSKGESLASSYYKTLSNVGVFIDQRGCLVVRAPKITNELIVTNDVVQLISESQFDWLGRYDNIVNSGGVKLYPEKIEEKIARILDKRFFVAGVQDDLLGEKLILIVEGKEQELYLSQKDLLSKYEKPKQIYFLDSFEETPTKKINRIKTLCKIAKK